MHLEIEFGNYSNSKDYPILQGGTLSVSRGVISGQALFDVRDNEILQFGFIFRNSEGTFKFETFHFGDVFLPGDFTFCGSEKPKAFDAGAGESFIMKRKLDNDDFFQIKETSGGNRMFRLQHSLASFCVTPRNDRICVQLDLYAFAFSPSDEFKSGYGNFCFSYSLPYQVLLWRNYARFFGDEIVPDMAKALWIEAHDGLIPRESPIRLRR